MARKVVDRTDTSHAAQSHSVVIPTDELIAYVASRAARIADESAARRDAKWRAFLTVVVGILALFGFTSITNLTSDIRRDVEDTSNANEATVNAAVARVDALRQSLEARIASEVKNWVSTNKVEITDTIYAEVDSKLVSELALAKLTYLAAELDKQTSFTVRERDTAIELLRRASTNKEITQRPEYALAVEHLLDAFAPADLVQDIDQLEPSIRDLAINNRGILITLTTYYSFKTIGHPNPGEMRRAAFVRYCEACERLNLKERAIPFKLLDAHASTPRMPNGEELIEQLWLEVAQLEPPQQASVAKFLRLLAEHKDKDGADEKRLSTIATAFCDKYADRVRDLERSAVPGDAPTTPPMRSTGDEGAAKG